MSVVSSVPSVANMGTAAGSQSDEERRLFCLELVVDKCSEKGTELLFNKYKPKTKKKVDVRGVKDMEDLKNRLKSYLREAQNNQCQLPQESEYAARACAVRFLDYPLLIIDRAKVKTPPTMTSHPLRGFEIAVPFGQGKSCMFHTSTRKLVQLLREHPMHFVYLDLRKKAEPKLVGTASIPVSDSLVLEHKGLHTHAPIYSITGEHLGVLSIYMRLSCHGSTLLRHLVNFRGISSPMPMKGEAEAERERERESSESAGQQHEEATRERVSSQPSSSSPHGRPPTGGHRVRGRVTAERVKDKVVADLSTIQSFESRRTLMYGRFKPPGLFYDPELEESETEGPANITPMPSQSSMRSELEMQEQEQNEAAVVVGVDPLPHSEDSATKMEMGDRRRGKGSSKLKVARGKTPKRKGMQTKPPSSPTGTSQGTGVVTKPIEKNEAGDDKASQVNFALDTHEIIRELALEISNAIKSGTGQLLSQVGIRKEDSFLSTEEKEMPELDLEIVESEKEEAAGLLTDNNVEEELEQLLQDLEQKPIASIIYGDQAQDLQESVKRDVESPAKVVTEEESEKATEKISDEMKDEKLEVEDKSKSTTEEEASQEKVDESERRLILSDPEEPKEDDSNESSAEESYTPFDESEGMEMEMESESTYLEVEKPTVEVDVQEPPPPVEEEGKDETAPSPPPPTVVETFTIPPPPPDSPAPPPEPMHAPEYDDGIHKSMAENPAMAAVDKLWEAEYSDVPTDLDSILDEASHDLLQSGTEADSSFIVEESEISEEIFTEEESVEEHITTNDPSGSSKTVGDMKKALTLFATTRRKK